MLKHDKELRRKPDQDQVKRWVPERMEKPLGRVAPTLRARDLPSIYPTATRLQVKNHEGSVMCFGFGFKLTKKRACPQKSPHERVHRVDGWLLKPRAF